MSVSVSLKTLVLCSFAGAVTLLAAGCDRQSGEKAQPQPSQAVTESSLPTPASGTVNRSHKGEPIPAITLVDNTGETLDLTSFKGKPLLINLWATWCAPCIAEMPTLNTLIGKEKELGITVLPISQDMGQDAKVLEILRRRKLDMVEPWIDEKGDLGFKYGGNLPVTVMFDSQGREVWRYSGGNDWTSPEAMKLIAEAK